MALRGDGSPAAQPNGWSEWSNDKDAWTAVPRDHSGGFPAACPLSRISGQLLHTALLLPELRATHRYWPSLTASTFCKTPDSVWVVGQDWKGQDALLCQSVGDARSVVHEHNTTPHTNSSRPPAAPLTTSSGHDYNTRDTDSLLPRARLTTTDLRGGVVVHITLPSIAWQRNSCGRRQTGSYKLSAAFSVWWRLAMAAGAELSG